MVASDAAGAGADGGAVMSTSFGQPPESRWYLRTLSAIAVASADAYQADGCSKTFRQGTRAGIWADTCEAIAATSTSTVVWLRTEHQHVRHAQSLRPYLDLK